MRTEALTEQDRPAARRAVRGQHCAAIGTKALAGLVPLSALQTSAAFPFRHGVMIRRLLDNV
jgi:hypothetical protein